MIAILFVICTQTTCFSASPPDLFQTKEECTLAAEAVIAKGKLEVLSGNTLPHSVLYKCVDWGLPA